MLLFAGVLELVHCFLLRFIHCMLQNTLETVKLGATLYFFPQTSGQKKDVGRHFLPVAALLSSFKTPLQWPPF